MGAPSARPELWPEWSIVVFGDVRMSLDDGGGRRVPQRARLVPGMFRQGIAFQVFGINGSWLGCQPGLSQISVPGGLLTASRPNSEVCVICSREFEVSRSMSQVLLCCFASQRISDSLECVTCHYDISGLQINTSAPLSGYWKMSCARVRRQAAVERERYPATIRQCMMGRHVFMPDHV